MAKDSKGLALFTRGDIDGFFGLVIDNLVNLILMVGFCMAFGLDRGFVFGTVLPGAALSIFAGNLFYFRQARRLARKTGNPRTTALPYGINTPSLIAYSTLIMIPAYYSVLGKFSAELGGRAGSAAAGQYAWKVGLVACFLSGLIEFFGSAIGEWVRRATPRAALLSTLAGIALALISMDFILKIFNNPLYTLLPMGVLLITYFGRMRFPLGIPGGLVTVMVGTAMAWALSGRPDSPVSSEQLSQAIASAQWQWFDWCGGFLLQRGTWEAAMQFLPVIIPMGLMNALGTLQNVESAAAAGDHYDTGDTMMANGLGSVLAACFGSCFPTTVYIGHPGWKAMGARAGYSAMNGAFILLLCLSGVSAVAFAVVPIEAGAAILLYIGVVIAAQAFQETRRRHAPAVALGFLPAVGLFATIAIKVFVLNTAGMPGSGSIGDYLDVAKPEIKARLAADPEIDSALHATALPSLSQHLRIVGRNAAAKRGSGAGKSPQTLAATHARAQERMHAGNYELRGIFQLGSGFLFSAMVLTAILVYIIERRFTRAAMWAVVGAVLSATGLMHSGYVLPPHEVADAVGFPFLQLFDVAPPPSYTGGWGFFTGYMLFAGALFLTSVLRETGVVTDIPAQGNDKDEDSHRSPVDSRSE